MLTTVILPPGVGNPGSVLPGLTPFPVDPLDPLDPVDPVDPLENSWKLVLEQHSNDLGHFARKSPP